MSDKAREGWLDLMCDGTDSNGAEFVQCDLYFESQGDSKHLHVIEYSAYKSIVAQLASERDAFGKLETELIKERDLAHKTANELRLKNLDLIKELAQARGLLKDHEDDWKRIQDAERALDEALAQSEFSSFDRVEKERDEARGLLKDHEDDWKRIQDAERALDEALAQSEFSNKHWTKMFDEERQKSWRTYSRLRTPHAFGYRGWKMKQSDLVKALEKIIAAVNNVDWSESGPRSAPCALGTIIALAQTALGIDPDYDQERKQE